MGLLKITYKHMQEIVKEQHKEE